MWMTCLRRAPPFGSETEKENGNRKRLLGMIMKKTLVFIAAVFLVLDVEARMNVLLITADDMGCNTGAYGDRHAVTPRLDALAADGVLFERGYVTAASCSPSRASILTGTYPFQNGQFGLANRGYTMATAVDTIPGMLKRDGYFNGCIGKIHVNPEESFGFDYKETNAHETYDVTLVHQRFKAALDLAGDRPFFLYVNYFDPHVPFHQQVEGLPEKPMQWENAPALSLIPPMELTEGIKKQIAGYYNGVARVDIGVGMLIDELKNRDLLDNTLILFVGDHGAPFPRAKCTVYEAGIQVPFIVRWPGVQQPHREKRLVSTIDLLPTVLDAAGIPVPEHYIGRSLRPLVANNASAEWRRYLYAEKNSHTKRCWYPQRSIRNERFKLIHTINHTEANTNPLTDGGNAWKWFIQGAPQGSLAAEVYGRHFNPPEWELYDLSEDPDEFTNLAGNPEFGEVLKQLQSEMMAWRVSIADPTLHPTLLLFLNEAHKSDGGNWNNAAWVKAKQEVLD
jgi:N-sulfoglucosamine sulfohydrolase